MTDFTVTVVGQFGRRDNSPIARIIKATKEQQIRRAFETSGASNQTYWKPLQPLTIAHRGNMSKPLVSTGSLRSSIKVDVRRTGALESDITVSSPIRVGGHNLGSLHQRGIDGPILPVRAKALFVPLLRERGTRGGQFRAFRGRRVAFRDANTYPSRVFYVAQYGRKGNQKYEPLEQNEDFVLLSGIYPTPEKGNQAVPRRPFATMTPSEREEIAANVKAYFRRRR